MKGKKGEFDFVWMFAIIAGAAILVLAIYGVVKVGETQRYATDTETAKQISILTDPMQAGFAAGSFAKISFRQDTKIKNTCYSDDFGRDALAVATQARLLGEWQALSGQVSTHNKYIFSSDSSGKIFYVFSTPFYFPYKISDLIFLTSSKYCFVEPPTAIEDELTGLNMDNIELSLNGQENCTSNSKKVCFGQACDISVYGTCTDNYCKNLFDEGYVEKNGEKMDYIGSLIYAAIFADKENYDCNVQRLIYRALRLSVVYGKKIDLMKAEGCESAILPDLITYNALLVNSTSKNIIALNKFGKALADKQAGEICKVWED